MLLVCYNGAVTLFKRSYRTLNEVRVSRGVLLHNLAFYRGSVPGVEVAPVLKANAYGHGLEQVARVFDSEGAPFLCVDSLFEAYRLRDARIKTPVLILGPTFPENVRGRRLPFEFAVADLASAEALAGRGARVHLKIDTGMNRLGFSLQELPQVLARLQRLPLTVTGVFTHLADADNLVDDAYTHQQIDVFERAVALVREAGFSPRWIHASSSAGAFKVRSSFLNLIRLGIGLYGVSPLAEIRPALEVWSTVVGVRTLAAGESVGYGCTFTADRAMRVGVIPFGYYEGLPRALSNKGVLRVNGVSCPIVGRVCMNYTMIDVSNVVDPKIGDAVQVVSSDPSACNSMAALAKAADTIPYELLVRLAESVRRVVV